MMVGEYFSLRNMMLLDHLQYHLLVPSTITSYLTRPNLIFSICVKNRENRDFIASVVAQ